MDDIARQTMPSGLLDRVIQQSGVAKGDYVLPDIDGLIAQLIKITSRSAARFNIYPFNLTIGQKQQILPNNPDRISLCVSTHILGGLTNNYPVNLLFDQGPTTVTAVTAQDVARSMFVPPTATYNDPNNPATSSFTYGSFLQLDPCPINAVTAIAQFGTVIGVIIEGTAI